VCVCVHVITLCNELSHVMQAKVYMLTPLHSCHHKPTSCRTVICWESMRFRTTALAPGLAIMTTGCLTFFLIAERMTLLRATWCFSLQHRCHWFLVTDRKVSSPD